MANLTKTLLDAISIIANKTIEEVSSDKTIKAIVEKVVSTSEGKYFVTCNGGSFYAYTQSGSTEVYQEGEQVYILVPEDDMGQKKFIIGRTENGEDLLPKSPTTGLLNDYVTLGDNAIIENKYSAEEGEIKTHKMQPLSLNSHLQMHYYYCYLRNPSNVSELNDKYDNFNYPCVNINEEEFSNSAKNAKALLIRSRFKASIDTDKIGNYGIIVNIAFADTTNPQTDENGETVYPPRLIAYVLDTSKMTGNPMRFYDYTSQYTIENFDGENFLYIDSIVAFSEGFVDQDIAAHDNDDDIYIYIDKLEVVALDEISATENGYKLRLTTPWGNTIKQGENKDLKISANLSYLGQIINKDAVFYWGVKDPSITSTTDGYNFKIGTGYRYLDNKKDELVLNVGDLTARENTYICTVTYESSIVLKASVSLYNNNNDINITIESDQGTNFQFNEGSPTLTCLINGKTRDYQDKYSDSAFSFVWSKEDEEFGTIVLDGTKAQLEKERDEKLQDSKNSGKITEILSYYSTRISQLENISYPNGVHGPQITCKLKNTNNYVIYSCSVYRGGVYVGYGSITLQNSKNVINNNYYITITNGSQVFQYNEAGIAPNSEKVKNPINVLDLTAVFHNPQGAEVTPRKVRWVVPQDRTLINIPTLGLQTDVVTGERYYSGNVYPLSIKDSYDSQCNNNQLTVIVTHADGTEYRQTTNLLFTKIGEIGTNGTDTVVKIDKITTINIPVDEPLTIIKQSNSTKYNNGNSISTPVLEANLYTNNNQVLGYNTKWTIAGTSKDQGRTYKVSGTSNNSNECTIAYNGDLTKLDTRIVEAEVSLQGKYYHSFYGIPAIEYESGYDYEHYPIRIIDKDTLKTVLYDSSGNNPIYNENQGVHVELENWNGYLEWIATGGPTNNNPNLLLSKTPRVKEGDTTLKIADDVVSVQTRILDIQDRGQACAEGAIDVNTQEYIKRFLNDIERIAIDGLLTIPIKLDSLWNRLDTFLKDSPDRENSQINIVYQIYSELFETIKEEYESRQDINAACTKPYDAVQAIWNSEWPSVITEDRLHIQNNTNVGDISNIEQLVERYKQVYNSRSDDSSTAIIDKSTLFDKTIKDYLNEYNDKTTYTGHPLLVECTQVLMAYLNLLVDETNARLDDNNYNYPSEDLKEKVKNQYASIVTDWDLNNIKENIKAVIKASGEEMAEVYDGIRKIYAYYQQLFLNVQKYHVAEESDTLSVWMSLLKGQNPQQLNWIYVMPDSKKSFNGLYMNNNVVGTVHIKQGNKDNVVAKVYVPIIMTLNTYELAALNGWDGTNVEIGDDHILTPQIGAGIKDSATNTFTGMVMGAISNTATPDQNKTESVLDKADRAEKVGLIGYSNGKQSVFIDAKTGSTYLGLPEQDSNVGIDEGRIELIPGGISKIGNWKIGNRFLYNIVDGTYDIRHDIDHPDKLEKIMVPHDKHGIILSSDKPYIHVKGEVYKNNNLQNINYQDEYNNISPGDSLELRMDPGDNSLFSIIQHTSGFGDENIDDLHFGYRDVTSNNDVTIVRDYQADKNINSFTSQKDTEYYIYSLATDANGNYQPYYQDDNNVIWVNSGSNSNIIINSSVFFKDILPEVNFKKTAGDNPVFSCDKDTGVITYNPNNLTWKNGTEGSSNGEGWQCTTEETVSNNSFVVNFEYTKDIQEVVDDQGNKTGSIEKDIKIGTVKNTSDKSLYQIKLSNSQINYDLSGINLDNSADNYLQFYVVLNDNDGINAAILESEIIDLLTVQNNSDIILYSINNNGLIKNTEYKLKLKLYIKEYTINTCCSCTIKSDSAEQYKAAPDSEYGVVSIQNYSSGSEISFTAKLDDGKNSISGKYTFMKYSNTCDFYFKLNSSYASKKYDFILWRKGSDTAIAAGQTDGTNLAKFFSNQDTRWENLTTIKTINNSSYPLPTAKNPWYISFYSEGAYTLETFGYETELSTYNNTDKDTTGTERRIATFTVVQNEGKENFSVGTPTAEKDSIKNTVNTDINTIPFYRLINENVVDMIDKNIYQINWGQWDKDQNNSNNYNKQEVFWNFNINWVINKENVKGSKPPEGENKLCVKDDTGIINLQGVPYAKTYWKNNSIRVCFYDDYKKRVNSSKNTSNEKQYGYIDIAENNNISYKYIKTLKASIVNSWFENKNSSNTWIEIDEDTLNSQLIYWKEFIRVGLDENGRFFSAGLQDKKTYSRTGVIHAFGKVPKLYGQEIRAEGSSNNYVPILKIFSQKAGSQSQMNTTYITQGQNDKGSISIRTAENGYIELAASQYSSNNENTVPEAVSFIQIGKINSNRKLGVKIQSDDNNKIELNKNLSINTNSMVIAFPDEIIQYQIANKNKKYVRIKTPEYILSSVDGSSLKGTEATSTLIDYGHYRINAFVDIISKEETNDDQTVTKTIKEPKIQLQVGEKKTGLAISPNEVELKTIGGYSIKINDKKGAFTFKNMKLEFDINQNIITLKNRNAFIQMKAPTLLDQQQQHFIQLSSTSNGSIGINIDNKITVKGRQGLTVEGPSTLMGKVSIKNNLYTAQNLYIGYTDDNKVNNIEKAIYLIKKDKTYFKFLAENFERLFDWYNTCRWGIACDGNTLRLRNVARENSPEGAFSEEDSKKYEWNFHTMKPNTYKGSI